MSELIVAVSVAVGVNSILLFIALLVMGAKNYKRLEQMNADARAQRPIDMIRFDAYNIVKADDEDGEDTYETRPIYVRASNVFAVTTAKSDVIPDDKPMCFLSMGGAGYTVAEDMEVALHRLSAFGYQVRE